MDIRCCSFSNMADEIKKKGQKIILFGAGAIGAVITPEILSDNGLMPYIHCYIDSDPKKWNTEVEVAGKSIKVFPPEYLREHSVRTAVLLNISRFAEVINQLEGLEYAANLTCYIMPIMCIYNFANQKTCGVMKDSASPLIPKRIHYMWLGGKGLSQNLQKCIDSWKKYCPDYEIIRWDETNYDISKNIYMKQAYQRKAYAFVSDYARLDILYNYGGIYMDTDVELVRSLDEMLYQEAFCGVEKWQVLNFGGCSGAVRKHKAIKKILDYREGLHFINREGEENENTCVFYDTKAVLDDGYKVNGQNQSVLGMNIYTYDYFHPYDYMSGQMDITGNTFSIHHFNGGWLNEKMRQMNKRTAEEFDRICKRITFDGMEGVKER